MGIMIPPDLDSMLRPLEEFETIRRRAVLLGDRLCDLSYANPYEGVEARTRQVLRQALDQERLLDLQYSPFGGRTLARRAVADDLHVRYQQPFAYEDIVLTPGAMAALHVALRTVGAPGDEVIIPTPCWLDYPLYARYLGLTPVLVPLAGPDFQLDADPVATAVTPRTCAVLLSHPANPTGRSYGVESITALATALQQAAERAGRTVTLIADEVHRDFVPGTYRSIAEAYDATVIVYSFGKYHFLQGQRTGYLAVSPRHPTRRELASDAVRWSRTMGFCTPTALMQAALPALLRLRHDLTSITRWRERMTCELRRAGYRLTPADATLFLYVATPEGWDDFDFIRALAAARVLALPAPLFHHRGYFRLSLTGAARMLEGGLAALHRLAAA
jgi:aspartate aminotransferase